MIELFFRAAFVENLALTFFLGICTMLGGSRRVETAVGLGVAITVVIVVTVPLNYLVYTYLLSPRAWAWAGMPDVDLGHLKLICFIGLIAAAVQILEMVLDRYFPVLFRALGIFLPLIAVNCGVLGSSLFMVDRHYNLVESVVFASGAGFGWAVAVAALAAIRERVATGLPDDESSAAALSFAIIGIMSLGYLAFGGINLP